MPVLAAPVVAPRALVEVALEPAGRDVEVRPVDPALDERPEAVDLLSVGTDIYDGRGTRSGSTNA